jgi:hypothetical protein
MLKPTMLKQTVVRKDQEQDKEEEDRGLFTPVLQAVRTGLVLLLGRLGRAGRDYALAGAGVAAAPKCRASALAHREEPGCYSPASFTPAEFPRTGFLGNSCR